MAVTWTTVISITDGGVPVKYQRETSAPDAGTGAGSRHRILENDIEYDPSPQGRPARSPNYIATSFDPFYVLDYAQTGNPVLMRITDLTP